MKCGKGNKQILDDLTRIINILQIFFGENSPFRNNISQQESIIQTVNIEKSYSHIRNFKDFSKLGWLYFVPF